MKAINITPEVIKMEQKLHRKGLKVAGYMLDQALNKEQIQIFKDEENVFWFENRNAAKYAVKFLISHITRYMNLSYRDSLDKYEDKPKKVVKKEVKKTVTKEKSTAIRNKGEDLVAIADKDDLKEFVNKYMKGYKTPKNLRKIGLSDEEKTNLFNEINKNLTEGFTAVLNKIYGGKKANFRNKTKMSDEERKEFDKHNREEFQWYFDTLVWIAKPSDAYIAAHKKFSTANYMKVSADLRSIIASSLFSYRTSRIF